MKPTHPRDGQPLNDNHANRRFEPSTDLEWLTEQGNSTGSTPKITHVPSGLDHAVDTNYRAYVDRTPDDRFNVSVSRVHRDNTDSDEFGYPKEYWNSLHEPSEISYRTPQRAQWAAQAMVNRHAKGGRWPFVSNRMHRENAARENQD